MGEIACHSAQWVKPFEAVSDVINLKHTQNQTVNTPQSCFCYNIFSLILLDLVNKLTVHNLPCPSGSFLFLDHICISVLSFFFSHPVLSHTYSYKHTCRWMHVFQIEKRVPSTTWNCGLPFWLTWMTSVHLFIVPTAGKSTHTHKYTLHRQRNGSCFKLNIGGVQFFCKLLFLVYLCIHRSNAGSGWFSFHFHTGLVQNKTTWFRTLRW